MNRQALRLLLRSGKFLCMDVLDSYKHLEETEHKQALFDEAALNSVVFFKEIAEEEEGENDYFVSTRAYFPYVQEDIEQGGESTLATAKNVAIMLRNRGKLQAGEEISSHDQHALEVMSHIPTFDPFLLMSKRGELQVDRKIADRYFSISKSEWKRIQRPILVKIAQLVKKAINGSDESGFVPRHDMEETGAEDEQSMIFGSSILDAIWNCQITTGIQRLMEGFGLGGEDIKEILFAWKGVTYYEYQYLSNFGEVRDFIQWLGSASDCRPRDATMHEESAIERCQYRRKMAYQLVLQTNERIRHILQDYSMSFQKLIREDDPRPFKEFLKNAPTAFLTIGMGLGLLCHSKNAWVQMSKSGGKRMKLEELESLFDFVISIHGAE